MTNSAADDGALGTEAIDNPILRALGAGPGTPVLVADFQPFSAAPRLSTLVSDRLAGRPVYQVDALGALSQDRPYIPLDGLAADAVQAFSQAGAPGDPAIVIGYCSAAALAVHIATRLPRSRETAVVLLRPSWPGTAAIEEHFAALAANLGAPQLPCPSLDGDPGDGVARMETALHGAVLTLAASQGLDGSSGVFDELLLTYRSWLAFLLACRNDSLPGWAGRTAAVTALIPTLDDPAVPGLDAGDFEVATLAALDADEPVTPEVADILVERITAR